MTHAMSKVKAISLEMNRTRHKLNHIRYEHQFVFKFEKVKSSVYQFK